MRSLSLLILALLVLAPIVPAFAIVPQPCGISIPLVGEVPRGYVVETVSFRCSGLSVERMGGYLAVSFQGMTGRISAPGAPALPFKSFMVDLGWARPDEVIVGVAGYEFEVIHVDAPIAPAPEPVAYTPLLSREPELTPDEAIYGSSGYFPGKLVTWRVGRVLGRTLAIIWLYPVQYSPLTGRLILFRSVDVVVAYKPGSAPFARRAMVIIAPERLRDELQPLADFYAGRLGIPSTIVSVEEIDRIYPPAENITAYPGFYKPYYEDMYYRRLKEAYNYTLALKIVSYLRDTGAHPDLAYVTIVGDALAVPPSFYYQSFLMMWYGLGWNAWIPTDFFYASPDYDLMPDYAVGRIPFSDEKLVSRVVEKIISWYEAVLDRPGWSRNLVMAGGYPFGLIWMIGEAAISDFMAKGYVSMFNLTTLTRTGLSYTGEAVRKLLESGRCIWNLLICHGTGDSIADVVISDGRREWETLANATYLLQLPENSRVPVLSSVACMDACWDEALLEPRWFSPPSFGEAVLMSPGAGIAYVGSSRIAWEIVFPPTLDTGVLSIDLRGAAWLHGQILRAYNSLMGLSESVGLGEVVASGIVNYLATTAELMEEGIEYYDIVLTTVFECALLGDAALQLPVFEGPFTTEVVGRVSPIGYSELVSAKLLSYVAGGNLSFYTAAAPGTTLIEGAAGSYRVLAVRVYYYPFGWGYLKGHITFESAALPAVNGTALYNLTFSRLASGLIMLRVSAGTTEVRYYLTAAGTACRPTELAPGGLVSVEAFGLDILTSVGTANVYFAGRFVASAYIADDGYVSWNFSVPPAAGGAYLIAVIPTYVYDEASALVKYLSASVVVRVVDVVDVRLSVGSIYEPGEDVKAMVVTLVGGRLVNASIEAVLLTPHGPVGVPYKPVGEGVYEIELKAPEEPGTYIILVSARYEGPYVVAEGSATASFVVTGAFSRVENTTREAVARLGEEVKASLKDVLGAVSSLKPLLEDVASSIAAAAADVKKSLLSVQSSLETLIRSASSEIIAGVGSEVEKAAGGVSARIDEVASRLEKLIHSMHEDLNRNAGRVEELMRSMHKDLSRNAMVTAGFAAATLALVLATLAAVVKRS